MKAATLARIAWKKGCVVKTICATATLPGYPCDIANTGTFLTWRFTYVLYIVLQKLDRVLARYSGQPPCSGDELI